MDRNVLLVIGIVAILAIAAVYIIYSQPGTWGGNESQLKAKICNPQEPSVKLYRCDQGLYMESSLPDVGNVYYDSSGNKLAQCGGFINKPPEPGCANYTALACNRDVNLCSG